VPVQLLQCHTLRVVLHRLASCTAHPTQEVFDDSLCVDWSCYRMYHLTQNTSSLYDLLGLSIPNLVEVFQGTSKLARVL
jgi:hypothetical protein